MMKPIYIVSASAISPQDSFESPHFLEVIASDTSGKLFVKEPDYRQYINPVAIRRMSRLIKMGISCGMNALQQAKITTPDAIITGTGLGSMTDTEKFLNDMIALEEEALNPTYFIQSTYNSVNGWISLQTKSTGYNQTYVNRGLSLEMALMDAQLFIQEATDIVQVLVGGFDELTDEYHIVKSKLGYWKQATFNNLDLFQHSHTSGTIGGEGAAFFVCTNSPLNAICSICGIQQLHYPTPNTINESLKRLLHENTLQLEDLDVVLLGQSGDMRFETFYDSIKNSFSENTSLIGFKHLVGEYPTSSGFALWMASQIVVHNSIPAVTMLKKGTSNNFRNILLINHYPLQTASLILLKKAVVN